MNFKQFSMLAILAIMFSGLAIAQSIKAPSTVEITPDSKEFSVKITNDTDKVQAVSLVLISPIDYIIEPTPTSLLTFTSQTFKIKLLPSNSQSNQTIKATLMATLGSNSEKKSIELAISGDFSKKPASNAGSTGFFALPSLGISNWAEILDILLIIIIAVLAIALVARLLKKSKKQGDF